MPILLPRSWGRLTWVSEFFFFVSNCRVSDTTLLWGVGRRRGAGTEHHNESRCRQSAVCASLAGVPTPRGYDTGCAHTPWLWHAYGGHRTDQGMPQRVRANVAVRPFSLFVVRALKLQSLISDISSNACDSSFCLSNSGQRSDFHSSTRWNAWTDLCEDTSARHRNHPQPRYG